MGSGIILLYKKKRKRKITIGYCEGEAPEAPEAMTLFRVWNP